MMADRTTTGPAGRQQTKPEMPLKSGCCVIPVSIAESESRMARDVLAGLSATPQKTLPSMYFYDRHGSELYERITELPEYYLTRAETAILHQIASELRTLATTSLGEPPEIVELGSGSSLKTRIILDEWLQNGQPLTYMPVDISESMLSETARLLTRQYDGLNVLGLAGEHEDAIRFLPTQRERLFLFLGSSLGNFSAEAREVFFQFLKREMGPESRLLLGFDCQTHSGKQVSLIEAAYNDRYGVTAEFNLNILAHINHRLGGNFELSQWRHVAHYNERENRIEMRLESLCSQKVFINTVGREFGFEAGETILTEISQKFDPQTLGDWFELCGFRVIKRWQDAAEWYGVILLQA